ncbi:MAG: hypothetical protein CME06_15200 [Gemmatimonadetes bacterium]|nr:hypothetical protein [Gemmatimonadota bacterium]
MIHQQYGVLRPFATAAIVLAPLQSPGGGGEGGWAFNCGSDTTVAGADGLIYRADQAYAEGEAGHLSGFAHDITIDHLYIDGPGEERALYGQIRVETPIYRFPVEPGLYELTLRMTDRVSNGPGAVVQKVLVDGRPLISDLDVYSLVGKQRSLDIRRAVSAGGDLLDVAIEPQTTGRSFIAAIALHAIEANPPRLAAVQELSAIPTYGGALLTWRQPPGARQDGYQVAVLDAERDLVALSHRYLTWALVPAGTDLSYEIAARRSDGTIGDAVATDGVDERDRSQSNTRWIELEIDPADQRRMERALPGKFRVPATLTIRWNDADRQGQLQRNHESEPPEEILQVPNRRGPRRRRFRCCVAQRELPRREPTS